MVLHGVPRLKEPAPASLPARSHLSASSARAAAGDGG